MAVIADKLQSLDIGGGGLTGSIEFTPINQMPFNSGEESRVKPKPLHDVRTQGVPPKLLPESVEKDIRWIIEEIEGVRQLYYYPYDEYKSKTLEYYSVILNKICSDICKFAANRDCPQTLKVGLFKSLSQFALVAAKNLNTRWGGNILSTMTYLSRYVDDQLVADTLKSNFRKIDGLRVETMTGHINTYVEALAEGGEAMGSSINAIVTLKARGLQSRLDENVYKYVTALAISLGINRPQAYIRRASDKEYMANVEAHIAEIQALKNSADDVNEVIKRKEKSDYEQWKYERSVVSSEKKMTKSDMMWEGLQPFFAERDITHLEMQHRKAAQYSAQRNERNREIHQHGMIKEHNRSIQQSESQNSMVREDAALISQMKQKKTGATVTMSASNPTKVLASHSPVALTSNPFIVPASRSMTDSSYCYASGSGRAMTKMSGATPGLAGMESITALYGSARSEPPAAPSYSEPFRPRGLAGLRDHRYLKKWHDD
ncbi:hypothetical protein IY40_24660 [Serratia marcescens]|nr:hypothetical protein IY40_24660 [Serratia marcescens]